ncbi:hypothetical protein [Cohnella sp.]|uniref:hypothetical protein n=1 Tax=Cohnella sp. TaxID=1883426 RepID=UPI003561E289
MKLDQKTPKQKQTNPLTISVIGLMLTVFGIVDYIYVNKLLGIILVIVGIFLGITGVQKYKALKALLQQKKMI